MRALLLAIAVLLGLAAPAAAHRGHAGLTVVEIDPASGLVQVSHRFAAHDVEPALVSVAPAAQPSLDDPAAVDALVAHLGARFRLQADGEAVELAHAATDLAGDSVEVRFAGRVAPGPVESVAVALDFFPGVHADQEQQVNVRVDGVTRSLVFRPGDPPQALSFAAAS